jgi:hypothetical protein
MNLEGLRLFFNLRGLEQEPVILYTFLLPLAIYLIAMTIALFRAKDTTLFLGYAAGISTLYVGILSVFMVIGMVVTGEYEGALWSLFLMPIMLGLFAAVATALFSALRVVIDLIRLGVSKASKR